MSLKVNMNSLVLVNTFKTIVRKRPKKLFYDITTGGLFSKQSKRVFDYNIKFILDQFKNLYYLSVFDWSVYFIFIHFI